MTTSKQPPKKVEARGFDDNLYAGVMGEPSDLFPKGTKAPEAITEIVEAKKQTQAAFMPAAEIIHGVVAKAKTKAFDMKAVVMSLPPTYKRSSQHIKDELRARELYTIFLDGLEKTIAAALAEGGKHES